MDRRTFVARLLPAMALAPLGLRLLGGRSLSGNGVATVTDIDPSAGSITLDTAATNPHWQAGIHPPEPLTEEILQRAYQGIVDESMKRSVRR